MTGRVSASVTRPTTEIKLQERQIRHVSQDECTGRMNSPLQDYNYLGVISVVGRVSDSVTRQRHLMRKLNCRGDKFATYQQDECTGRMNSPLQDCNYLGVISVVGRVSDSVTRQSLCGNNIVGATNSPRITGRMYWANVSPLQSNAYFFCIMVFKESTLAITNLCSSRSGQRQRNPTKSLRKS